MSPISMRQTEADLPYFCKLKIEIYVNGFFMQHKSVQLKRQKPENIFFFEFLSLSIINLKAFSIRFEEVIKTKAFYTMFTFTMYKSKALKSRFS